MAAYEAEVRDKACHAELAADEEVTVLDAVERWLAWRSRDDPEGQHEAWKHAHRKNSRNTGLRLARELGGHRLIDSVTADELRALLSHGLKPKASHREALAAYRVAVKSDAAVTRYEDVALEALLLDDEMAAKEFARRELGSLGVDTKRETVLRETLRAYFKCGHNGSATAATLGVHERTVGYRLSTIEQRLGHPIVARRDELSLALRLLELCGS